MEEKTISPAGILRYVISCIQVIIYMVLILWMVNVSFKTDAEVEIEAVRPGLSLHNLFPADDYFLAGRFFQGMPGNCLWQLPQSAMEVREGLPAVY